ncbi:MAG: serine hydroxymethyltransferase [bacterium]|nr:serine hydroxymethyltransferase [bacterium]
MPSKLQKTDPKVFAIIKAEEKRQEENLSLIPSENFFSPAVRKAVGSVVMHKYSEGNVGQRYYEGNENIDELEQLAIDRALKLFRTPKSWGANVQALSGSNANLAVYLAVLDIGDTMMGMYLPDGGHLSHGWSYEPKKTPDPNDLVYEGGSRRVHITSKIFKTVQYKTDPKTRQFDYAEIERIAMKYKPKLIITGGTAYPRDIKYRWIKQIAKKAGALYMADIAHEAGLVAAGVIPSPVGIADIVTMTTHKTLRSGRGAIILAHEDLIKKINRAVLPGLQGGPHNHNIAGICVGLGEALKPNFKRYAQQVVLNAKALAAELSKYDFQLVAGGADKHLILIDLTNKPILGKKFARALALAGIVANFNTMPQETRSPADPSALRVGTPWVTTRGMKQAQMPRIARWMNEVMDIITPWADLPFDKFEEQVKNSKKITKIAKEVKQLCKKYPLDF